MHKRERERIMIQVWLANAGEYSSMDGTNKVGENVWEISTRSLVEYQRDGIHRVYDGLLYWRA
jgi:hypothetical protein